MTTRPSLALAAFACGSALLPQARAQSLLVRASLAHDGSEPNADAGGSVQAISRDGRSVFFESQASNLVAGDSNRVSDVFVRDLLLETTTRVSVASDGGQANGASFLPALSGDGRFVAFASSAKNLVPGDNNGVDDVFVRDLTLGTVVRASIASNGGQANGTSIFPQLSADGRFVVFQSFASNLVPSDTNGETDVFVHDLSNGMTERVSVDGSGNEGNGASQRPMICGDGSKVAFESIASNLVTGDQNGDFDVFVRDRSAGTTFAVSVRDSGRTGNGGSVNAAISSDGGSVAFLSQASNLVQNDQNGQNDDIFVRDLMAGTTEIVSLSTDGQQGSNHCQDTSLSEDGRFASFTSHSTNLVPGDTNGAPDIFVRDRTLATLTRWTVAFDGTQGNSDSGFGSLSGDGSQLVFLSFASNLAAGDAGFDYDVFVANPVGKASWANYGFGWAGTRGIPTLTVSANPVFGTTIDLLLANSSGDVTVALIFAGLTRASLPTIAGGTLLVEPLFWLPITVPATGAVNPITIPTADVLFDLVFDLQAIQLDAGASHGVSFTPGLELVVGN